MENVTNNENFDKLLTILEGIDRRTARLCSALEQIRLVLQYHSDLAYKALVVAYGQGIFPAPPWDNCNWMDMAEQLLKDE